MENFFNIEWVGSLSYLLALLAFVFRNVLYLRITTILASIAGIIYFYYCCNPHVWTPMFWEAMFILVNLAQIIYVIIERSTIFLKAKEKLIYELNFKHLSPVEFKKLIKLAEFKTAQAEAKIIHENMSVDELILIYHGSAAVKLGNKTVAECNASNFIGEMAFVTNEPASADVYAKTMVKYIAWDKEKLIQLLDKNPDLKTTMYAAFDLDLIKKLAAQNKHNRHHGNKLYEI